MDMSQKRARQTRQRSRTECRSRPDPKRRVTLKMLSDIGRMETTLELEYWASWLWGELWRRRKLVADEIADRWELALGARIVDDFADIGGRDAYLGLMTVARFDRGELGSRAFELACGMREDDPNGDWELPDHVRRVGRPTITQAEVTRPDPDGEALLLESRSGDEDPFTVAVFIDGQMGWIAKRIGVVRGLDEIAKVDRRERDGSAYEPNRLDDRVALDPTEACETLRDALMRTDLLLTPPVDDEYVMRRALAMSRACSLA
jgi:hypothetical protein